MLSGGILGIWGYAVVLPMLVQLGVELLTLLKYSPRGGGGVEVGPEGLYVKGQLALPRAWITRAVVTRYLEWVTVLIERRRGLSVVDVESEEQGEALVKALGLDAAHTLSMFLFDSPVAARIGKAGRVLSIVILGLFLPVASSLGWTLRGQLLGAALGLVWLTLLLVPSKLSIGLDGIVVRWLWRRQLFRFVDLHAIERDGVRLRLTGADGRRRSPSAGWTASLGVWRGQEVFGFRSPEAYVDAVVARAQEALAAGRTATASLPAEQLLRGGRDLDTWMGELRAVLARGARGFREAEAVPEWLWAMVEDGRADPVARAAAAVALGPVLDDAERGRLRGVARVVVSPRLRVAIEAAADGDEEGVREALAELSSAESPRTKRV